MDNDSMISQVRAGFVILVIWEVGQNIHMFLWLNYLHILVVQMTVFRFTPIKLYFLHFVSYFV